MKLTNLNYKRKIKAYLNRKQFTLIDLLMLALLTSLIAIGGYYELLDFIRRGII